MEPCPVDLHPCPVVGPNTAIVFSDCRVYGWQDFLDKRGREGALNATVVPDVVERAAKGIKLAEQTEPETCLPRDERLQVARESVKPIPKLLKAKKRRRATPIFSAPAEVMILHMWPQRCSQRRYLQSDPLAMTVPLHDGDDPREHQRRQAAESHWREEVAKKRRSWPRWLNDSCRCKPEAVHQKARKRRLARQIVLVHSYPQVMPTKRIAWTSLICSQRPSRRMLWSSRPTKHCMMRTFWGTSAWVATRCRPVISITARQVLWRQTATQQALRRQMATLRCKRGRTWTDT